MSTRQSLRSTVVEEAAEDEAVLVVAEEDEAALAEEEDEVARALAAVEEVALAVAEEDEVALAAVEEVVLAAVVVDEVVPVTAGEEIGNSCYYRRKNSGEALSILSGLFFLLSVLFGNLINLK